MLSQFTATRSMFQCRSMINSCLVSDRDNPVWDLFNEVVSCAAVWLQSKNVIDRCLRKNCREKASCILFSEDKSGFQTRSIRLANTESTSHR
jgi:hypothetical protein